MTYQRGIPMLLAAVLLAGCTKQPETADYGSTIANMAAERQAEGADILRRLDAGAEVQQENRLDAIEQRIRRLEKRENDRDLRDAR